MAKIYISTPRKCATPGNKVQSEVIHHGLRAVGGKPKFSNWEALALTTMGRVRL